MQHNLCVLLINIPVDTTPIMSIIHAQNKTLFDI